MLIILSPAKSMDTAQTFEVQNLTTPEFDKEAQLLASKMQNYTIEELKKKLKISPALADSTFERYKVFDNLDTLQTPALLAYTGTVFKEIKATDFTQEIFDHAQQNLRIISVLYGLLRPLDNIKAYRMEYNLKLDGLNGDIYKFWNPRLTLRLIEDVNKSGGVLINLASLDVLPALDMKLLKESVTIITPEFKSLKNGKYEVVRTYAKISRGAMTHYILKNKISDPKQLQDFEFRGYKFNPELSTDNSYIFTTSNP